MKFSYRELLQKVNRERVLDMIVIEGVVGVGKSSLMNILGQMGHIEFEEPVVDNPILDKFYHDTARYSFALQVLAASASIKEKTIEEIVYNDLKIFEIEKYKVALGQINIMSIDDILPIREQIQEYLDNFTKSNNFGICVMIFSVVDGSGSYLISSGSALFIADAAFADIGEHCDGYLFLKEVMSRKKQIVPLLTEAAKNYRSNYHA